MQVPRRASRTNQGTGARWIRMKVLPPLTPSPPRPPPPLTLTLTLTLIRHPHPHTTPRYADLHPTRAPFIHDRLSGDSGSGVRIVRHPMFPHQETPILPEPGAGSNEASTKSLHRKPLSFLSIRWASVGMQQRRALGGPLRFPSPGSQSANAAIPDAALPAGLRAHFHPALLTRAFWKSMRYHRERVNHRWFAPGSATQVHRPCGEYGVGLAVGVWYGRWRWRWRLGL